MPSTSRRSPFGFSVTIALLTVFVLGFMSFQLSRWQRTGADHQLRLMARAIAAGVASIDSSSEAGEIKIQSTIQDIPSHYPEITAVIVLEGSRFLAHSEVGLKGTRLERDNLEHKAFYDDGRALEENLARNFEERSKFKELERNPFPTSILHRQETTTSVAVPVLLKKVPEQAEEMRGQVVVVGAPIPIPAGHIAFSVTLIAALVLAAAFLLSRNLAGALLPSLAFVYAVSVVFTTRDYQAVCDRALQEKVGNTATSALAIWEKLAEFPVTSTPAAVVTPADVPAPATVESEGGAAGTSASAASGPATGDLKNSLTRKSDIQTFLAAVNRSESGDPMPLIGAAGSASAAPANVVARDGHWVEVHTELQGDARYFTAMLVTLLLILLAYVILHVTGKSRTVSDAFIDHWYAYAYISPAVIGTLILVFGPFLFGIGLGFWTRVYSSYEFVGFQNFVEILSDVKIGQSKNFYRTLGVTAMWTLVNVSLHLSIGLGLALLLKDKSLRFTPIYRTLLVIPWALPNYITALIWKGMFNKEFGAVNTALSLVGVEPVSWFNSFWGAFAANLVTNVWLGFPFMMVISLGALQSIPVELYEAADVDGAGKWDKFWRITVPLLKPALFPAVILGTIWTFNQFNVIYLVSGGAPNNETDILITEAYRWAFEGRNQYGYAAAYSTIIFVILFGYTYVTNKITRSTEGAYE